ncbi:Rho-related GTP-binding protein RhoD [Aix galericulata]|nr:Rho-related GTP-binding protein RhoD [Aix galericulata]
MAGLGRCWGQRAEEVAALPVAAVCAPSSWSRPCHRPLRQGDFVSVPSEDLSRLEPPPCPSEQRCSLGVAAGALVRWIWSTLVVSCPRGGFGVGAVGSGWGQPAGDAGAPAGSREPWVRRQEGRREGRGPRVTPAAGPREGQGSTSHLLGQEEPVSAGRRGPERRPRGQAHRAHMQQAPGGQSPPLGPPEATGTETKAAEIKAVIVGDGGCGKTSLLMVFARGDFPKGPGMGLWPAPGGSHWVPATHPRLGAAVGEQEYPNCFPMGLVHPIPVPHPTPGASPSHPLPTPPVPCQVYVPTVFEKYTASFQVDGKPVKIHLWDTAGQEDYDRLRPLSYSDANVVLMCFDVTNRSSYDNILTKWYPEVNHFCKGVPVLLVGCKTDLRQDPEVLRELRQSRQEPVTSQQVGVPPRQGTRARHGAAGWGSAAVTTLHRERPWPGRSTPRPTSSARPGIRRTSGTSSPPPAPPRCAPPDGPDAGDGPGGAARSAETPHPRPGHRGAGTETPYARRGARQRPARSHPAAED